MHKGVSRETHNFDVCTARKMFTYNGGAHLKTNNIVWCFDKKEKCLVIFRLKAN